MLLLVALLLQVAKGGIPAAPGFAPVNDLTAAAIASHVELACTIPLCSDGSPGEAFDVEIRYSTTKAIETDLEWNDAVSVFHFVPGVTMRSGDAVSCVTPDLANGTYWFAALVKGTLGWSTLSSDNPDPVTIGGSSAVPPVTGLAVVPGSETSTSVQLTWNALTGAAAEVMIYRGTSTPTTAAFSTWISGTTTVTVPGLDPSTAYCFGAIARNASHAGDSPMSAAPHPFATTLAGAGPGPGPESGGGSSPGCPQSATGSATAGLLALAGLILRRR